MNRTEEYIDSNDILRVPVARSIDKAPEREGWTPFFVNINLDDTSNQGVQKVVSYKRASETVRAVRVTDADRSVYARQMQHNAIERAFPGTAPDGITDGRDL